jgi:serine/arginine repetitive matrix protein 1
MAGTMFRGTNVEQDSRWGRTDRKIFTKMEKSGFFAPILETKVDLKKVNIDIMSKWVTERIVQLLGFEDEIVINLIINMLNTQKVR